MSNFDSIVAKLRAALRARALHRGLAAFVLFPSIVTFSTGVLLHLRNDLSWIQPRAVVPVKLPDDRRPLISLDQALQAAATAPEAGMKTWADVAGVDFRPARGMIGLRTKAGFEVQVDARSGVVLGAALRRTGWLIELHEGGWFHESIKRYWFLPSGVALVILWGSGVLLLLRSKLKKR